MSRKKQNADVTFGHSKARRPDLKPLLYILTVTEDGGVPIYFTSDSGNVTDDTTHRQTWDLFASFPHAITYRSRSTRSSETETSRPMACFR